MRNVKAFRGIDYRAKNRAIRLNMIRLEIKTRQVLAERARLEKEYEAREARINLLIVEQKQLKMESIQRKMEQKQLKEENRTVMENISEKRRMIEEIRKVTEAKNEEMKMMLEILQHCSETIENPEQQAQVRYINWANSCFINKIDHQLTVCIFYALLIDQYVNDLSDKLIIFQLHSVLAAFSQFCCGEEDVVNDGNNIFRETDEGGTFYQQYCSVQCS